MQKQYTIPTIEIRSLYPVGILCVSGDPGRINGPVHGGDKSGDINNAF